LQVTLSNTLRLQNVPPELHAELVKLLQFTNPKWLENERMGRWNRGTPKTLTFFRRTPKSGLIIPRGFMRRLIMLAREHGLEIHIEDRRRRLHDAPIQFHGELKGFQQEAVDVMLKRDFGTLSAPTGCGKTIMALSIISHRQQPALIIVHTRELAHQWIERIHAFLEIPKEEIGVIGGGKRRVGDRITVALVQSLYKCAKEVSPHFGHLVVDECHRTPSRTFTEAVRSFDSQYMLGLSATPWRRDRLSQLIYWHLGDVHHEIKKTDLVSEGHILDIDVRSRPTEFKPYYDPVNEYSKMLSELTLDDRRNHLIAGDVAAEVQLNGEGQVCLVLSDRKHHCSTLHAILKHKYHVSADILTGDLNLEERRQVVERVNEGKCRVLIATGQLVGEGFDCPNLSVLFLATPIRFSGRVLQYLGRVLRPSGGMQTARVYDYIDIHVPALMAAAQARQRVYASRQ
jgi:superfamily II DNA or RNA helicase